MIYIHVPFCRSFCTYCAFYSENRCSNADFGKYLSELKNEIARRSDEIGATRGLDTLYIGGGTPSVLPLSVLEAIVSALPGGPVRGEFTVEVNPDDVVEKGGEYLRGLRELGVNRISMGVQSLDDATLKWMNRRHDALKAREAFGLLRKAGFDNVSVDIIYGFEGWKPEGLEEIADGWRPEHVSAYQLGVEEGSALYDMAQEGRWREGGDELCEAQFAGVCKTLAAAGYGHYELSNWALPGRIAAHNSAYWARLPYAGLGPAAHSLSFENLPDGSIAEKRSWNSEAVSGWTSSCEILSVKEISEERIMLGLRTSQGIPEELCPGPAKERLLASGALVRINGTAGSRVRIPENRWFTADNIISELF